MVKFCKNCMYHACSSVGFYDSFKNLCTNPNSLDVVVDVIEGVSYHAVLATENRSETGQCKPEGKLFDEFSYLKDFRRIFTVNKKVIGNPI